MSFFSKIKSVGKTAIRTTAKAANAPTSIATRVVSKVAPRPVSSVFRKAVSLTPTSIVARAALAVSRTPAAQKQVGIFAPGAPIRGMRQVAANRGAVGGGVRKRIIRLDAKPVGILARIGNAITQPTAAPSSGQMLAPSAVQAVAAAVSGNPYSGGAFGPPSDDRGGYDDGSEAVSPEPSYYSEDDPTEDMPDGFFDAREDDGDPYALGDVDYHAALAGLGDWKSDLAAFGTQAGKTVATQALTAVAKKITGGGKPYVPPPPAPGLSMIAKVGIGAAIAVPIGYFLLRRRPASASTA